MVVATFLWPTARPTISIRRPDSPAREWSSGGDYATRVHNIRTGAGLSNSHKLHVGTTVSDDEVLDYLFGSHQVELNWYIYNLAFDQITGLHPSEEVDDTNGILPPP